MNLLPFEIATDSHTSTPLFGHIEFDVSLFLSIKKRGHPLSILVQSHIFLAPNGKLDRLLHAPPGTHHYETILLPSVTD